MKVEVSFGLFNDKYFDKVVMIISLLLNLIFFFVYLFNNFMLNVILVWG